MTWTKLSDDFTDDTWTMSDKALRLHIDGLCWSNRKLLDLRIPKDDLRRFKHPDAIEELLADGWWGDVGEHYEIRHHAMYQRLKVDVIKQQEANQRNGSKGGRPRKREQVEETTETQSVSESVSESKTERDRTGQDGASYGEAGFEDDFHVDAATGVVTMRGAA